MKVKFDKQKTINEIINQCKPKMENMAEVWLNYADNLIPEDTRHLLVNNKKKKLKATSNWIVTWIENKTDYAVYVEYWVKGRVYDYHKPKWAIFYSWVWMWMYAKTKAYLEQNTKKFITNIKV